MYQLKALIWKSYKVRIRSPVSTTLDLFGPIFVMILYVGVKIVMNQTYDISTEEQTKDMKFFRNVPNQEFNIKQDIKRHMCNKILYHSMSDGGARVVQTLQDECGFELVRVSTRQELVNRLMASLNIRMAYKQSGSNLNQLNSTVDNCIKISQADTIYQTGLVHTNDNSFEFYMTDSAGSPVVQQHYTQGSTYNEYKLPHSDLNMGTHLIEICLAYAFGSQSPTNGTKANVTQFDTIKTNIRDIKWRFKPYPIVTGLMVVPGSTAIAIMLAFFCTNIPTMIRVSEANEYGLHRYTRLTGLTACHYWTGLFIVTFLQAAVQSLIITIILAIPTGNHLYDSLTDASMTFRWILIFTYSLATSQHVTFLASLFDRSGQALMFFCLTASAYVLYPALIMLQWNPYGFRQFIPIDSLILTNPAAVFHLLHASITYVALQTDKPFGWSNLGDRIINGGLTSLSVGEVFALLAIQILIWTLLTILYDQYKFCTASNIFGYLFGLIYDSCVCNCCCSNIEGDKITEDVRTKSIVPYKSNMSKQQQDPNRICCSIRHADVRGASKLMPYTRGNPLRLSKRQMERIMRSKVDNDRAISKTSQYLINRNKQNPGVSLSNQRAEPIVIDESISQSIVWYKTDVRFEDLDLDFRFNQISFILGETDLKELFFDCLLGLRTLQSGHIIIDGTKYTPASMDLARKQIGYLCERDMFHNELTIFENLQFFGSLREPSYKSFDSESLYILNLLHLSSRSDRLPSSLTHRSARKLALGVASVGYTKLLLLTEPTMNLHWRPRCQVYNLLKKYKSIRSIVIDSTDVDEAVAFGDRIVLLKGGCADLNDTPARLTKKLACGYWLVFEPTAGDGRTINSEAIMALEKLTNDLFRQDKLDMDATKRSTYQNMMSSESPNRTQSKASSSASKVNVTSQVVKDKDKRKEKDLDGAYTRAMVVVKVQHTDQSTKAICTLLKMFASGRSILGFRLAHLSYESLEDILVLRMSRATYPELPPDLLLSLQHRTQSHQKTQDQMPVSVRKLSSESERPNMAPKQIYSSNFATIAKDRFKDRSEILISSAAILGALAVIAISLYALQNSLGCTNNHDLQPKTTGFRLKSALSNQRPATTTIVNTYESPPSRPLLPPQSTFRDSHEMSSIIRSTNSSLTSVYNVLDHSILERIYKYRTGLYLINESGGDGSSMDKFNRWDGSKNLIGFISRPVDMNQTDAEIVANLIHDTKDIAASFIVFNQRTSEATVIFEPHLPHVMLAGIKTFINYNLALDESSDSRRQGPLTKTNAFMSADNNTLVITKTDDIASVSNYQQTESSSSAVYKTSRHYFHHPWHEMIRGFSIRRMIYGIGFAIAESLAMGVLVVAPIRHRNMQRQGKIQSCYWFSMALFDMMFSLIIISGYILLFATMEGFSDTSLIAPLFIVLFLYKLASLPIPYMTSFLTDSPLYGFLFIFLIYFTISWDFAIFLKSFVEWTLISSGYLYTIANWLLFGLPITALIDSITVIFQVNNINKRCRDVPAFTKTTNTVDLDGVHRYTIIDDLLDKVRECLTNGKMYTSTNVYHQQSLGILWSVYLIILFGLISWTFLFTCERYFGIIARRFGSSKTSYDPMKTIVRLPDNTTSMFKWDKERDRLISEYIKCINEINYVRSMATNCLILRIWLKPMSDQTSIDKRLWNILDPLIAMGHTKSDIQIELRTTLQLFIRIGDENKHCRVDKISLIETYSKFMESHSDTVAKFAVIDWTRENLYKLLLHGHYNSKVATTM